MTIHRTSCNHSYEEYYEVEKIVDVLDRVKSRWYLVKYVDYPWSRGNLLKLEGHSDSITRFWDKNGL